MKKLEDFIKKKPLAALSAGIVGAVGLFQSKEVIRNLTEARLTDPFLNWAKRAPGSAWLPAYVTGDETIDTIISASQLAVSVALLEGRKTPIEMAKLGVISHLGACAATWFTGHSRFANPEELAQPDSGPSGISVSFGANYLATRAFEAEDAFSRRLWALGNVALGVGSVVGAVLAGSSTAASAHAVGYAIGTGAAIRENR